MMMIDPWLLENVPMWRLEAERSSYTHMQKHMHRYAHTTQTRLVNHGSCKP